MTQENPMPKELTDAQRRLVAADATCRAITATTHGQSLSQVRETWIAAFDAEAERLDKETNACSQS